MTGQDERMTGSGVRTGTEATNRRMQDPESGGPPTARNFGWYQLAPEQRYVAYISAYQGLANAMVEGELDQFPDLAIWALSHAAVDTPAIEAGINEILSEEMGAERDGLIDFHNSMFGNGTFQEGQGSQYSNLGLPQIDTEDPEGTIERFIAADIGDSGRDPYDPSRNVDSQVEKALVWTAGLFEKVGDVVSEGVEAFGGPEAERSESTSERLPTNMDSSVSDLFRQASDETFGPDEQGAAQRRNAQDKLTGVASAVAAGYATAGLAGGNASGLTGARSTVGGGIGSARARMLEDRMFLQRAMSSRWNGEMMAINPPGIMSPVAQAVKGMVPGGLRQSMAQSLNGMANAAQQLRGASGPVGWAARRPRWGLAAGAAGTLGYGVADAYMQKEGDINDMIGSLPEGDAKNYIYSLLEQQQTIQGGE